MKCYFRAWLTLCIFSFSLMTSVFSVQAIDELSSDLTEEEIQLDEIQLMPEDSAVSSDLLPGVRYLYNADTFSYYDQLNENNQVAYDAMKVWLTPDESEFTVSLPDAISYKTESTDMSSWDTTQYNEFWNLIFSNIIYGKMALSYDYPELFWLDSNKIKISIGSAKVSQNVITGIYTMKISQIKMQGSVSEEYTDVDTALEYKKLIEDSVDSFEVKGDDRYQQVKYIHDYIAGTVTYNADAPFHDAVTGLFTEPYQIVCEGYSKAFKILCDKSEIPCIVVPGNINTSNNTGHMWNYVMMEDNNWYGIDCTWDDTNMESNPVKYTYFLKGSTKFNTNHTPDTQYVNIGFTYPELSKEDYVYDKTDPLVTTAPVQTTVPYTTKTTIITSVSIPASSVSSIATETKPVVTTDVHTHIKGDYNLDEKIDVSDMVLLRKLLTGAVKMDDSIPNDDLNDDNIINIFDYIILSRKILGGY